MVNSLILFADAVEKGAEEGAKPDGIGGLFSSPMFPILIVMVLFFFLIILPAQRRQKREQESILSNLKKNDEVVTASGIIGIVAFIKETGDEVTLKVDDNTRIRVLKSSIARILKKDEAPKEGTAPAANTNIKPTT